MDELGKEPPKQDFKGVGVPSSFDLVLSHSQDQGREGAIPEAAS